MAYLKKQKKRYKEHTTIHYFSVVLINDKQKYISLKTTDERVALERHEEVEDYEHQLKKGTEYQWSWLGNSKGRTKIKKLTLNELVEKFIGVHKTNVRIGTITRYKCAYNSLMNVLGKSCPPQSINNQSIETWKKCVVQQGRKNNGINIDLRAIKTFLLWSKEEGYIKQMPKIKMLPTETKIKYINESDWSKIMELDIDNFYKDCFKILRGIGVRRSDLVKGRIDGQFLVVDAINEKTNTHKDILLTDEQLELVVKVHTKRDETLERGTSIETFLSNITRAFEKACKKIGIYEQGKTNLHCLRHTFAVREYLKSRDIFKVCQLLHHSSVTTTEKYARLNINRLEQDFPSLTKVSKVSKIRVLGTKNMGTNQSNTTLTRLYN